jgi:hypothetical protein
MMVVMRVLIVPGEFKSGLSVAQFDAANQAHIFEQCDGAVDSGQVACAAAQRPGDFLRCRGAAQLRHGFQDALSGTSDTSTLVA